MSCTAVCHEGLKEWEQAELWQRRMTERYPNSSLFYWYCFCKRTGHGDTEAAREYVEQSLAARRQPRLGRSRECRPILLAERVAGESAGPPAPCLRDQELRDGGFAMVMIADDLGDLAQRRRDPGRALYQARIPRRPTIQVFRLLRDSLAAENHGTVDLKAIDQVLESTRPAGRGNIEFFVGWFLRKHGKVETARSYLKRCSQSSSTFYWLQYMAIDELGARDETGE